MQPTDLMIAADNHEAASSGTSIFESTSLLADSLTTGVVNHFTKSVPLAGRSIVNSFVNTAGTVANFFGASFEKADTLAQLREADDSEAMVDFYQKHQTGIETGALVVGSILPGTLAVKGLALGGKAIGALNLAERGKAGENIARATGLLTGKKQAIIDDALAQMNSGKGIDTVFGNITKAKYQAIAYGFGEQAIQAAAWETATVLTMSTNPMLDKGSLGDILSHMWSGVLVGGAVGGVIEGLFIRHTLNKALQGTDKSNRIYSYTTQLGMGDIVAGDRVEMLLRSLDGIPLANTPSAAARLNRTQSRSEIEAMRLLRDISPEGDANLGITMLDTLYKMRNELGVGKEEMYDAFGRLAKISRPTPESHLRDADSIFINKFKDLDGISPGDFITGGAAHTGAVDYLRYQNTSTAGHKVARWTDETIDDATGSLVPKYTSASAAFKDGADIYIGPMNGTLGAHVNPASKNLKQQPKLGQSNIVSAKELAEGKQLLSAPYYFNTISGNVTSRAFATFGDLGHIGNIKATLTSDGVVNGGYHSVQSLEAGFDTSRSALDASARNVYAAARGIKSGDTIATSDIPFLEELLRSRYYNADSADVLATLQKQNIKFRNAYGSISPLPTDAAELEQMIWAKKNELIKELLGDGSSKVDVAEVALKANVPQAYIEGGLHANSFSEVIRPLDQHTNTTTLALHYDIGTPSIGGDGNILRGLLDTQMRLDVAKQKAMDTVTNYWQQDTAKFVAGGSAEDASILGAGSTGLGFANAEYGTLAQSMEGIGSSTTKWIQDRYNYVTEQLRTSILQLQQDKVAATELDVMLNVGRKLVEKYMFLPEDLAKKYANKGVTADTMVLRDSLVFDKASGKAIDWKSSFMPREGIYIDGMKFEGGSNAAAEGAYTYYKLNPLVATFLKDHTRLNDERLIHANNFNGAVGSNRTVDLGTIYFPPVDTTQYKHVAIVRDKSGIAFGTSDAAALVAHSTESLQAKVSAVLRDNPDAQITFKDTSKKYHEALGDYDYNMNLAESAVDSNLRRRGILSDILPRTNGDAAITEFFQWHMRQETRQTRNMVELANAQLFAELRFLGEGFVETAGTVGSNLGKSFEKVDNPFEDYVKTALAIGKKEQYTMWSKAQDTAEAFASSAFAVAKEAFTKAASKTISYEEAVQLTQKFGLGNPYERTVQGLGNAAAQSGVPGANALENFAIANKLPPGKALSTFVQITNSVTAATVIRLDFFQTLLNVISTPVLQAAEFASVKSNPALRELLTTTLPGTTEAVPAYSKAVFNAVGNVMNSSKKAELLTWAERLNVVNSNPRQYFEMLDHLTLVPGSTAAKLEAAGKAAVDIGAKLTRSDWGEQFSRLVTFDVARQLFTAKGFVGQQLDDNIRTFVNRVNGNYIASQRPVAFQGPIGQAVGLFQTYQFNLLQQLFRFTANKDAMPVATLFGIQTSLFGLQSIPGFQAINTHIVGNASGNPEHKDLYSEIPRMFDKTMGDWLLYGSLSNILGTGLYSRGDINPRQITVLPVNPANYPAISAGIRFMGSMIDVGKKLADGGKFGDTILQGIEHHGLSRPLAGLAQQVNGYSTTNHGNLIAAASDWGSITSFMRMAGSRPLDEAIVMDANYRRTAYKARDTKELIQLGEAVKTTLVNGNAPTPEQLDNFAASYAAAGGRIEHFGQKMIEWTKDANEAVANKVYKQLRQPTAQNMMVIMGGQRVRDFSTAGPSTATTPIE